MTQSASAPAPAPTGAPTAQPATATPAAPAAKTRRLDEDVPRLLNRLQVLAVAACVAFGVVAAVLQVSAWQANGRAADNTEQVVRVQQIQSSLLRADALGTNAFLVGGLEPAEARAAYDTAVDDTLRLITDAARAQPADRAVLADLNTEVATYDTRVTQARDNNRQGFPVGAAYLNLAGNDLRGEALPIVAALVDANSDRAVEEMSAQHPFWLFWLGVVVVALLVWVNQQVAKRFHRRVNVGLAVAGVLVVALTLLTSLHGVSRGDDNDDTRAGSYRTAIDEARARTAANDAKAQESLGLVNRGQAAAFEDVFSDRAQVVAETASPRTLRLWNDYLVLHEAIREADDGGDWDAAVRLATDTDPTAATGLLNEVDYSAQQVTDSAADQATDELRSGGLVAVVLVVLTVLGSLAAAGAATSGLARRRKEYS